MATTPRFSSWDRIQFWPVLWGNVWIAAVTREQCWRPFGVIAMLANRCCKLLQCAVVKLRARLARILLNSANCHFVRAPAWRRTWKKRIQATTQATTSLVHALPFSAIRRDTSSASAL